MKNFIFGIIFTFVIGAVGYDIGYTNYTTQQIDNWSFILKDSTRAVRLMPDTMTRTFTHSSGGITSNDTVTLSSWCFLRYKFTVYFGSKDTGKIVYFRGGVAIDSNTIIGNTPFTSDYLDPIARNKVAFVNGAVNNTAYTASFQGR